MFGPIFQLPAELSGMYGPICHLRAELSTGRVVREFYDLTKVYLKKVVIYLIFQDENDADVF